MSTEIRVVAIFVPFVSLVGLHANIWASIKVRRFVLIKSVSELAEQGKLGMLPIMLGNEVTTTRA